MGYPINVAKCLVTHRYPSPAVQLPTIAVRMATFCVRSDKSPWSAMTCEGTIRCMRRHDEAARRWVGGKHRPLIRINMRMSRRSNMSLVGGYNAYEKHLSTNYPNDRGKLKNDRKHQPAVQSKVGTHKGRVNKVVQPVVQSKVNKGNQIGRCSGTGLTWGSAQCLPLSNL